MLDITKEADNDIKVMPNFINYSHHPIPAAFKDWIFKNQTHNPRARTPQFSAFKGPALFEKIKDLRRWEQMQELEPWFDFDEILIVFFCDEEYLKKNPKKHAPTIATSLGLRLKAIGFTDIVLAHDYGHKWQGLIDRFGTATKYLENHIAVREGGVPLPFGTASTTISIPGPVVREYTVINQPFPPVPGAKIGQLNKAQSTCTIATIELYHDIRARKILASKEWMHYRQIDPSLKPWNPWSPGESIASVNPQVLDKNHFMQTNCFTNFWIYDYRARDAPVLPSYPVIAYCREHERYEYPDIKLVHLLEHLGCGFFQSFEEWATVVILRGLREKGKLQDPDRVELSHGCGNGFTGSEEYARGADCVNPFCGIWETHRDNLYRDHCHSLRAQFGKQPKCVCPGGLINLLGFYLTTLCTIRARTHTGIN